MGCFKDDALVLLNVIYSKVAVVHHQFPLIVLLEEQLLEFGRHLDVAVDDGLELDDQAVLVHVEGQNLLNAELEVLQIRYFYSHY